MILQKSEKNAEKRSLEGTGKIDKNLTENKLSSCIIDTAIEVHTVLGGPGLLESVYETQKKLGLVLNFGQPLLRDGICRVVNNF